MDGKEIKEKYEDYFTNDEPVPYYSHEIETIKSQIIEEITKVTIQDEQYSKLLKQLIDLNEKKIDIYPVTMKDYSKFNRSVNCLSIEKNKIPDPKIITMSYLDFIVNQMQTDKTGMFNLLFYEILSLCLQTETKNIVLGIDNNNKIKISINDIIFDKTDFDNIRKIICYQNIFNYDDTYIDPKVEKAIKEAEDFVNKHNKKMGSLEDQEICVLISTSLKFEDIKQLTIRKFFKIIERINCKLDYQISKGAEMSGMVTFEKKINHWMCDLSKDKYSDVFVDYDEFKNKMKMGDLVTNNTKEEL